MGNIVIFGAGGTAGSQIAQEAFHRGHRVTAAVRRPEATTSSLPTGVQVVTGDATSERSVREAGPGGRRAGGGDRWRERGLWLDAARTLVGALRETPNPPRIIHLGGGATLCTPQGDRFLDQPGFPQEYRDAALGQADALAYYRSTADGVRWTYVSPPPLEFHPGARTGHYRTGGDHPVTDHEGRSVLSYQDMAVAIVDEIENPRHENTRFTAAY